MQGEVLTNSAMIPNITCQLNIGGLTDDSVSEWPSWLTLETFLGLDVARERVVASR